MLLRYLWDYQPLLIPPRRLQLALTESNSAGANYDFVSPSPTPISSSPDCVDSVLPSPTPFLLGKHLARSRIYQRAVQDMQATNLCVYSCEFVRVLVRMCMCTCAHTTSKSIAIKEVSYGRRTHIYIVTTSIHVHAYAKTIMSRQTRRPDIIYRTIIIDEFYDRV